MNEDHILQNVSNFASRGALITLYITTAFVIEIHKSSYSIAMVAEGMQEKSLK